MFLELAYGYFAINISIKENKLNYLQGKTFQKKNGRGRIRTHEELNSSPFPGRHGARACPLDQGKGGVNSDQKMTVYMFQ
jgi:hypothetical protein